MNLLLAYFHSKGISQRFLLTQPFAFDDWTSWKSWAIAASQASSRSSLETVRNCTESSFPDFLEFASHLRASWIGIVHSGDPAFPPLLRSMQSCPNILYFVGNVSLFSKKCFSIVWSRSATAYSESVLCQLVPRLWASGFSIVSGGAKWADRIAHEQAIRHSVPTLCVFGTDIFGRYPAENRPLFDSIVRHDGLLLSPFAVWVRTRREHFAIRNAIVAGLSSGILVTEAGERSGSVITIRHALDFWRDTYAVPGDISRPLSSGCNSLIRDSLAKAYTCPEDIEGLIPFSESEPRWASGQSDPIIEICGHGWLPLDEICAALRESISSVTMRVTKLELEWKIKRTAFWTYSRI